MTPSAPVNFFTIPEIVRLKTVLEEIAPEHEICVAYSGGLDSRFLSFCAKKLGFRVNLLHIIGPQIAPDETADALKDAEELGLEPILVPAASLTLPELAARASTAAMSAKRISSQNSSTLPANPAAKAPSATARTHRTSPSIVPASKPSVNSKWNRLWSRPASANPVFAKSAGSSDFRTLNKLPAPAF